MSGGDRSVVQGGDEATAASAAGPRPDVSWAEHEEWIWHRTLAGETADFDVRYGASPEPQSDDPAWVGVQSPRRVSAKFLSDLMTLPSYANAIPRRGVSIRGAFVPEDVSLDGIEMTRPLVLSRTRFAGNVSFKGARFLKQLSLQGSHIAGTLDLTRCSIEQSLVLKDATLRGDVTVRYAKIGGQLDASGCKLLGELDMNSADVAEHVFFTDGARVEGDGDLGAAKIGGQLNGSRATFVGTVDMNGIRVGTDFFLDEATFQGDVRLRGATIGGQMSVDGSAVSGAVMMDGVEIGEDLFLDHSTFGGDVTLRDAKVGGQLNSSQSVFSKDFDMDGLNVTQDVFFDEKTKFMGEVIGRGACVVGEFNISGAAFASRLRLAGISVAQGFSVDGGAMFADQVRMSGAMIGGVLRVEDASFADGVDLSGGKITRDLFLGKKATCRGTVDLRGTEVGGTLDAEGAVFQQTLEMERLRTGGSLLLRGAHIGGGANIVFARIGTSLDLSDSDVAGEVDLTGTEVTADLRLGSDKHRPTRWGPSARLNLRNAHVGAIQDGLDAEGIEVAGWPSKLVLDGFCYDHLGGLQGEGASSMARRSPSWFKKWLEHDESSSPQPSQYLAKVLRDGGRPEAAAHVLYAARERERAALWKAGKHASWLGRSMLKVTIGYGLGTRYFRALLWVIGFTIIGMVVLLSSGNDARNHGVAWCAWASLDEILPLVDINKAHAEFVDATLRGWRLWYFYAHRIVGYVLGSFIVAGLSGLTQET